MELRLKVYCRVRPPHPGELTPTPGNQGGTVIEIPKTHLSDGSTSENAIRVSTKLFTFDAVFPGSTTNSGVYDTTTRPLVEHVLAGYRATLLCYGQTGTGKTHTMSCRTPARDEGIMFRAVRQLFEASACSAQNDGYEFHIQCTYVQLYRDNLQDLLNPETPFLRVRPDNVQAQQPMASSPTKPSSTEASGGNLVKSLIAQPDGALTEVSWTPPLRNFQHFLAFFDLGDKNRVVAETKMNKSSSRGHSVLSVHVHRRAVKPTMFRGADASDDLVSRDSFGTFTFVDLAGYERLKLTQIDDAVRKEEAKTINLSLSALATVIHSLTYNAKHVPWRNSKLTQVLKNAMSGNSMTSVILTIGPSGRYVTETLNTLYFGHNAIQCKTTVQVNTGEIDYKEEYASLRNVVADLSLRLRNAQTEPKRETSDPANHAPGTSEKAAMLQQQLNEAEETLRWQKQQMLETDELIGEVQEEMSEMQKTVEYARSQSECAHQAILATLPFLSDEYPSALRNYLSVYGKGGSTESQTQSASTRAALNLNDFQDANPPSPVLARQHASLPPPPPPSSDPSTSVPPSTPPDTDLSTTSSEEGLSPPQRHRMFSTPSSSEVDSPTIHVAPTVRLPTLKEGGDTSEVEKLLGELCDESLIKASSFKDWLLRPRDIVVLQEYVAHIVSACASCEKSDHTAQQASSHTIVPPRQRLKFCNASNGSIDLSGCWIPATLGLSPTLFSTAHFEGTNEEDDAAVMNYLRRNTAETISRTLNPFDPLFPRAFDVVLTGRVIEGSEVNVLFKTRGGSTNERIAVMIRWYQLSCHPLTQAQIVRLVSEDSTRYRCTTADVGKELLVEVTPFVTDIKDRVLCVGSSVLGRSLCVVSSLVPTLEGLRISGNAVLGGSVAASYVFCGGEEGGSIIQWHRSLDGRRFHPFYSTKAPDRVCPLTSDTVHQYIRVQVTPLRSDGAKGNIVVSKLVFVNLAPDTDLLIGRKLFVQSSWSFDVRLVYPPRTDQGDYPTSVLGTLVMSRSKVAFRVNAGSLDTAVARQCWRELAEELQLAKVPLSSRWTRAVRDKTMGQFHWVSFPVLAPTMVKGGFAWIDNIVAVPQEDVARERQNRAQGAGTGAPIALSQPKELVRHVFEMVSESNTERDLLLIASRAFFCAAQRCCMEICFGISETTPEQGTLSKALLQGVPDPIENGDMSDVDDEVEADGEDEEADTVATLLSSIVQIRRKQLQHAATNSDAHSGLRVDLSAEAAKEADLGIKGCVVYVHRPGSSHGLFAQLEQGWFACEELRAQHFLSADTDKRNALSRYFGEEERLGIPRMPFRPPGVRGLPGVVF